MWVTGTQNITCNYPPNGTITSNDFVVTVGTFSYATTEGMQRISANKQPWGTVTLRSRDMGGNIVPFSSTIALWAKVSLFVSNNNGITWEAVSGGIPTNTTVVPIGANCINFPGSLFVTRKENITEYLYAVNLLVSAL